MFTTYLKFQRLSQCRRLSMDHSAFRHLMEKRLTNSDMVIKTLQEQLKKKEEQLAFSQEMILTREEQMVTVLTLRPGETPGNSTNHAPSVP